MNAKIKSQKLHTVQCKEAVTLNVSDHYRLLSTQENKHGIGPDRNKIEPISVLIFCSSLLFEPVICNPDG